MTLEEKINADLKTAMMAREEATVRGLRSIKSGIILIKTEKGSNGAITPEREVQMLQKMVKQRRDSISEFEKASRQDLITKEQEELAVIEKYLPAMMSEDEVRAVITKIIAETGATSPKEMGKVMGAASKQLAGKADNKMVADTVKSLLRMIFDILFIVFIALGFRWGYRNGIIYSLFSIAGVFTGVIAALKFSYLMVNMLNGIWHTSPKVLAMVSFILVFALVALFFKLVAWGLEQILKSFSLNLPNQIIGGVLYSFMGLYLLCVAIWFLNKMDAFPNSQKATSHVYGYINNIGPQVVSTTGRVIPFFRDAFNNFEKLF